MWEKRRIAASNSIIERGRQKGLGVLSPTASNFRERGEGDERERHRDRQFSE